MVVSRKATSCNNMYQKEVNKIQAKLITKHTRFFRKRAVKAKKITLPLVQNSLKNLNRLNRQIRIQKCSFKIASTLTYLKKWKLNLILAMNTNRLV